MLGGKVDAKSLLSHLEFAGTVAHGQERKRHDQVEDCKAPSMISKA